jgi:hypothetical protein
MDHHLLGIQRGDGRQRGGRLEVGATSMAKPKCRISSTASQRPLAARAAPALQAYQEPSSKHLQDNFGKPHVCKNGKVKKIKDRPALSVRSAHAGQDAQQRRAGREGGSGREGGREGGSGREGGREGERGGGGPFYDVDAPREEEEKKQARHPKYGTPNTGV